MQTLFGKSVYKGIAAGTIAIYRKRRLMVEKKTVQDTEAEMARYCAARESVQKKLQELCAKAAAESGESGAAIFEAHLMMLEDEDYQDSVRSAICHEHVNAEYAVKMTGEKFSGMLKSLEDDYLRARAEDVKDVSERMVAELLGEESGGAGIPEGPSVVMAEDLAPGDTVQMEKDKVLALVTVHGSVNSHTAILARMMGIPALVKVPVDLSQIHAGMYAVVDGYRGELFLDPDEEQLEELQRRIQAEKEKRERLQTLKGKEDVTKGGRKIRIFANIGGVGDIEDVLESDAKGIGLFRSEFLYMGREDYPTEEEQFQAYKEVARAMEGKPVVIRTVDVGADKQIPYFNLGEEANPAMGYRGIRICLACPELFKTQLKALLRAAVYGNIAVMYPMIISVEEIERIKVIMEEAREELEKEKIPYKMPSQGVMIETPAAVMIGDELAEAVDFFSIGTNDLTQYTLAVDRQNEKIDSLYQPHHKAVLRMIQMTADHAHRHGKWVGICGELAADTELTEEFLRMGIDELSVAPSRVLELREYVRGINH